MLQAINPSKPVPHLRPSKKAIAWEKARRAVEQLTDRMGKGIDAGVKETVAALMIHGFSTVQSCEGHLDWGLPFPWIEIRAPEPDGWRDDQKKEAEWRHRNVSQQQKMLQLLSEFYRQRRTPFDAQLCLAPQGFGSFRLRSIGAEVIPLLSPSAGKAKLSQYQKEMSDFTAFLNKQSLASG